MTYPPEFRAEVIAALRAAKCCGLVARACGVSATTVRKWARAEKVKLPPPQERMSLGARHCAEQRRTKLRERWDLVRRMSAEGHTQRHIAETLGYSEAMIAYILVQEISA